MHVSILHVPCKHKGGSVLHSCAVQSCLSSEGLTSVYCVLCRSSTDAGSSTATGLAGETIPEDEAEEDVAPTPEQLEVSACADILYIGRC